MQIKVISFTLNTAHLLHQAVPRGQRLRVEVKDRRANTSEHIWGVRCFKGIVSFSPHRTLHGWNYYSLVMDEELTLKTLKALGWSPQLLGSRARTELGTLWFQSLWFIYMFQGQSWLTPTWLQSNHVAFSSPRLGPELFQQTRAPHAWVQTWEFSDSVL